MMIQHNVIIIVTGLNYRQLWGMRFCSKLQDYDYLFLMNNASDGEVAIHDSDKNIYSYTSFVFYVKYEQDNHDDTRYNQGLHEMIPTQHYPSILCGCDATLGKL